MTRSKAPNRSAARLAAVQALYQLEMEKPQLHLLLDEFHMHRLGAEIEDDQYLEADVAFFDDVVRGVAARRDEIDDVLTRRLADGWSISRLDRTMLQILRAGAYELMARADINVGTVIGEYLDVAHAFFDARETKFVNGLLDAVAKDVRK
ncbi:transcription antitermination factor NusB [Novosphingobium sp.]|uniref:transcription antitermination factor NusB n=1 Tax=Novosphingobium sp. TaxID=1874826 RepID=UPI00262598BC|nr:transcription antitermination factor NusB [Novosphingobium sp.]